MALAGGRVTLEGCSRAGEMAKQDPQLAGADRGEPAAAKKATKPDVREFEKRFSQNDSDCIMNGANRFRTVGR